MNEFDNFFCFCLNTQIIKFNFHASKKKVSFFVLLFEYLNYQDQFSREQKSL